MFFYFENRSWDRFQLKEENEEKTDVDNQCKFKLIRLIMYVGLFVVFLAGLVTHKLSLVVASSKLSTDHHKNEKRPTNSSEPYSVKQLIYIYTLK